MPFYIRGGLGPLRYSHRIGGRRRSSGSPVGGCLLGLFLLIALIAGAFQASVALGVVLIVALVGLVAFLAVLRRRASTHPPVVRNPPPVQKTHLTTEQIVANAIADEEDGPGSVGHRR